jgi:hypothetical protein
MKRAPLHCVHTSAVRATRPTSVRVPMSLLGRADEAIA